MTADDQADDGVELVVFGETTPSGRPKTVRFGPRPTPGVRAWTPGSPKEPIPEPREPAPWGFERKRAPAPPPMQDVTDDDDDEAFDDALAQEADAGEPQAATEPTRAADGEELFTRAEVEDALNAALEQERAAMQEQVEAGLAASARVFERALTEMTRQWHDDLVELSVRLARKIVGEVARLDPSVIVASARHALRLAGPIRAVTMKCHPDDAAALREVVEAVAAEEAGRPVEVVVRPSDDIRRGGVLLSFADGIVDARVDKQLEILSEAVKAALGDVMARRGDDADDGGDDLDADPIVSGEGAP